MKRLLALLIMIGILNDALALKLTTVNVGWLWCEDPNTSATQDIVPHVKTRRAAFWHLLEKGRMDFGDLVVLQEVYDKSDAESLQALFQKKGYASLWPKRTDSSKLYSSGLFVAARKTSYRILNHRFEAFTDRERVGDEKYLDNGLLFVNVESVKDQSRILLIAVHLQAISVNTNGSIKNQNEQKAHSLQLGRLQKHLNKAKNEQMAVILAGDFNVGPILAAEQFRRMENQLSLDNAFPDIKQSVAEGSCTWDMQNPLVSAGDFPTDPSDLIDHVFFSPAVFNARSAKVIFREDISGHDFPLSDHYGLQVELEQRQP